MSNNTFGNTIGRALGYSAAATIHGACVAATYTGQFGQDIMTGTAESYTEHKARLAMTRGVVGNTPIPSIAIKTKRQAA